MNDEQLQRDFKGVWIPKEIYLNDQLTWTQKILYCEIDSLDNDEGCFATNEYFATFLGIKERAVRDALSRLKELGLVEQVGFDGRKRRLKTNPVVKQTCRKMPLRPAVDCHHNNIGYSRLYSGNTEINPDSNYSHPSSPSPSFSGDTPETPDKKSVVSDALERFQDGWNNQLCSYCPKIAKITVFNEARRSKVKARLAEALKYMKAQGVDKDLLTYFLRDIVYDRYTHSQFLRGEVPGKNGTDSFKMDINHIVRPEFFAKMVEYRYDDRSEYRN